MAQSAQDTWTAESSQTAIYDPVPGASESGIYGTPQSAPHELEREVQRVLLNLPNVEFSSLRVNRLADGVCLTGVVRVDDKSSPAFADVAGAVAGVDRVLNYLVVRHATEAASKEAAPANV